MLEATVVQVELGITAAAESDGIKASWTAPLEHPNYWASLAIAGESDFITYEYLGAGESGSIVFPVQPEGFYEIRLYTSNALGSLHTTIPVTVGTPTVDPTDPVDPEDPIEVVPPWPQWNPPVLRKLSLYEGDVFRGDVLTVDDQEAGRQLAIIGNEVGSTNARVEVRIGVTTFPAEPDEVLSWTK